MLLGGLCNRTGGVCLCAYSLCALSLGKAVACSRAGYIAHEFTPKLHTRTQHSQLRVYSISSSTEANIKPSRKSARKASPPSALPSTHLVAQIAAVDVPAPHQQPHTAAAPSPSAAIAVLAGIVCAGMREAAEQQGGVQGSTGAAASEPSACAWVCSERTPNHITVSDSASSSTGGVGPGVLDSFLQLGQVFLPAGRLPGSADAEDASGVFCCALSYKNALVADQNGTGSRL